MRLVAKTKLNYATRVIQAGEEFDAKTEHDARILCDTINAPAMRKPEQDAELAPHELQGRAHDPDATGHELQGRRTAEQEARYRRRDMRAKS